MPLVGHQHQIEILELTDKGDGKGCLFDRPLFVEGLLPGEQALVELTEVKPNYLHGKLVELKDLVQPREGNVARKVQRRHKAVHLSILA